MRALVSVIVCVYNRAHQVSACVDSLLAPSRPDLEIVLVDDGSTDDTPQVLQAHRAKHPDTIRITTNARNLGVSGARNAGIAAASGEFIAFTDSDCTVEPGWIEAMLEGFTEPDLAGVAGTVVDHEPRTWAERAYVGTCRIGTTGWQGRALVGNNMAFRGEILRRYLFDPSLRYGCDEDELAWRLQSDGYRIGFAPRAVVHHDHRASLRQYWRTGYRQGQGSARYWYKRGRWIGRDVLPGTLALVTLPLAGSAPLAFVPAFFALAQVAALFGNQWLLKGKSLRRAIAVLPIDLVYSLCKMAGVYATLLRILAGAEPEVRQSKRTWWRGRPQRSASGRG
ncbi:MAG: glycosyltransferase [Acidobacteria bacterium]|jgi:GT2 family glycosyltransferase|nr:glycosyltransferase [Acidobacteriota bacterium]